MRLLLIEDEAPLRLSLALRLEASASSDMAKTPLSRVRKAMRMKSMDPEAE